MRIFGERIKNVLNKFLRCLNESRLIVGAVTGIIVVSLFGIGYAGVENLLLGWGKTIDFFGGLAIGVILILVLSVILYFILRITRVLPLVLLSIFISASYSVYSVLRISDLSGLFLVMTIILLSAIFGAVIAFLISKTFRSLSAVWKTFLIVLFSASLVIFIGILSCVVWVEETSEEIVLVNNLSNQYVESNNVSNPSEKGKYKVRFLTYGSGVDKREEYGEKAQLETHQLNGKMMVTKPSGKLAFVYSDFWGYEDQKFPLNGRVWYPDGDGPFPAVFIVHGNHLMREDSDSGFSYLGELLASRGFMVVSIDENFLNDDWSAKYNNEMMFRGLLILEHLKLFENWDGQVGNPFFKKVDFNNLALIGHSRGGEAIIAASFLNHLRKFPENADVELNYNFNIKTLIAISPGDRLSNSGYKPLVIENVNYLLLYGSHDADVSRFVGDKQYKRIIFTNSEPNYKSSYFIYRANHSQFNSVWGRHDWILPKGYLLNTAALLSEQSQREVAKVLISAFLNVTLKNDLSYLPVFKDHRVALEWLPKNLYINNYDDSFNQIISDFEEDMDIETATLANSMIETSGLDFWKEADIGFVNSKIERMNRAVYLEWNDAKDEEAIYSIRLADTNKICLQIDESSFLNFSISDRNSLPIDFDENSDWNRVDFTITCTDQNGEAASLRLSSIIPILPPLKTKVFRFKSWEKKYSNSDEVVLQYVEIPMMQFVAQNNNFDPGLLRSLDFVFDQSKRGTIILDDIGIRSARN